MQTQAESDFLSSNSFDNEATSLKRIDLYVNGASLEILTSSTRVAKK